MIWRLKGDMVFNFPPSRQAFIDFFNAYIASRTVVLNESEAEEIIEGVRPVFRMDIALEPESETVNLQNVIQGRTTPGLQRAFFGRHKCRVDPLEPPPTGPFRTEVFYWSFP